VRAFERIGLELFVVSAQDRNVTRRAK